MRPTITMKLLAAALLAATPLASQADGLRIPLPVHWKAVGGLWCPASQASPTQRTTGRAAGAGRFSKRRPRVPRRLLGLVDDFQSHCLPSSRGCGRPGRGAAV